MTSPEGVIWHTRDGAYRADALPDINALVRDGARDHRWGVLARERWRFQGLELGRDDQLSQIHARGLKTGFDKGRFAVIQADGVHTPYRQHQRAGGDLACPHCGSPVCDLEHILWRCPRYAAVAGDLGRQARAAWREHRGAPRCFWTLGHVPKGWAPDPSSLHMREPWDPVMVDYDPDNPEVFGATDGGARKLAFGARARVRGGIE